MKKYRPRVSMIEAIRYLQEENIKEVQYFFNVNRDKRAFRYQETLEEYGVRVKDADGKTRLHILTKGEWIVRELDGSYRVYREDEFQKKYIGVDE